ncbi:hypothetical protein RGQ29_030745 [Quercus rubra]|uniref:Agenet domain-containing protein n=1 Tax=Quercus rubra TaxID=3512 RepID=A0AAN7EJL3_QUERU|nr:hypothetical protein RGQ29_030745 [Quercus rubra]
MPRKKHDDTTAQSYFSIGDEVEVTSIDHNLRGTLFPAKIIGKDWNADKFVVEYKHLEANDEPLREESLGFHQEWDKGAWLPPREVSMRMEPSSSNSCMKNLSKGTQIEVCSDEAGFEGAWFSAKVINAIGQDKYLVEYKSLRTEDNKQFLREEVDIKHMRPRPPDAVVVDSFNLNEEVDAYYNDGWWEGVISRILKGSKYKIYFKRTKTMGSFVTLT